MPICMFPHTCHRLLLLNENIKCCLFGLNFLWSIVALNFFFLFSYYNRFAARPDQWKLKQSSKQSTYKEFYATFGSRETKSFRKDASVADTSKHTSHPFDIKNMRKEIDHSLDSAVPSLGLAGMKRHPEKEKWQTGKFAKHAVTDDISRGKNKKKNLVASANSCASGKGAESAVKPFLSEERSIKKRHRKDRLMKSSKKLKT